MTTRLGDHLYLVGVLTSHTSFRGKGLSWPAPPHRVLPARTLVTSSSSPPRPRSADFFSATTAPSSTAPSPESRNTSASVRSRSGSWSRSRCWAPRSAPWIAGRTGRPLGTHEDHAGGRDPVRDQLRRPGAAVRDLGSGLLAGARRCRDRHGLGDRPAYIAEVSPPAYRGRLGSFQQLAIVLGIAVSQLVNYAIARAAGGQRQQPAGGPGGLAVDARRLRRPGPALRLLSLDDIPESPRFLIAVGRRRQARRVLAEVEGEGIDLDARLAEIQHALRSERRPPAPGPARPGSACCRSSGSASGSRSSSSSSAST